MKWPNSTQLNCIYNLIEYKITMNQNIMKKMNAILYDLL